MTDQENCASKPIICVPNPSIMGFCILTMAFECKKMLTFAAVMKRFAFFSLYWATSVLLLAVVLCSIGYRMLEALLLSTSLLPIAVLFRQMIVHVNFNANRREAAKRLICILLFVLTMAFLAIHIAQMTILYFYRQMPMTELAIPSMLLNPIFLLSMLLLMVIGDYCLGRYLTQHTPEAVERITFATECQSTTPEGPESSSSEANETISFVSNRQSMTLAKDEILYVESCDTEVWIHATGDRRFRNKTTISSWARLLGSEYLRIHRSYLVRLYACTGLDHDNVVLGDVHLPISRKYKDIVQQRLNYIAIKSLTE